MLEMCVPQMLVPSNPLLTLLLTIAPHPDKERWVLIANENTTSFPVSHDAM